MSGKKEFDFEGLRKKLDEQGGYPKIYFFKFIVPSDNKNEALVQALFNEDAQIDMRASKTGKYVSISAKEVMLSTENIINRYKAALKIEGCIAL